MFTTGRLLDKKGEQASSSEVGRQQEAAVLLSTPSNHVAHIQLNRPKVKNAVSLSTAAELLSVLNKLEEDSSIRCILLSGNGPDLTSGVDIRDYMSVHGQVQEQKDPSRAGKILRNLIESFQAPFKRMHTLSKPIICVAHGLCFGLGIELAACSDIRYCSKDTRFAIREVRIGLAADVGSLQLMPHLASNQSLLKELIYTGRELKVDEAVSLGFVSRVCDTKDDAIEAAIQTAKVIANRSPVAVQGSRRCLTYSKDKSFEDGLEFSAIWNMCMMQTSDIPKAMESILSKTEEDSGFDDY